MVKNLIEVLQKRNLFTSRLALARTLLAISALGTILFTNISLALDMQTLGMKNLISDDFYFFKKISIYTLFSQQFASGFCIIFLLIAISGYYPQVTIFLQTWVHTSICNSVIEIDGGDQIAANLCLLLIPICLLDNRRNQWNREGELRPNVNIFANIYYFLILLQVAIIYLHAAVGKLYVDEWLDGTCLYYWTTSTVFGAPVILQKFFNFFTLSRFSPIFAWSIIFLELGLFACLFATNLYIKRFFLIIGIIFHFIIIVAHGLTAFFFATSGSLILYLDRENYVLRTLYFLKPLLLTLKINRREQLQ